MFKNEYIYILCRENHKNIKRKVKARTFVIDDIILAIVGNSFSGFSLTMVENGMQIIYSPKLKDIMNNIEDIVFKLKNSNQVFLENAKKLYDEAEKECNND